jgi:hypothetical protein
VTAQKSRTKPTSKPRDQRGVAHSWAFTPGPDGGKEIKVRGVPTPFMRRVRAKAKRGNRSVRSVVLELLRAWVDRDDLTSAVNR